MNHRTTIVRAAPGEAADQDLRLALARACEASGGPGSVAARIGISVSVVLRVLAGQRVYAGSLALVREALGMPRPARIVAQ